MNPARCAALAAALCSLAVAACGGSNPEPKDASSEQSDSKPAEELKSDEAESSSAASSESKPADADDGEKKPSGDAAEPTFPENATVDQAMAAVPKGTPRSNIDPERLAEPLQKPGVYDSCKVGTQHFKVRVAVWGGHAVGVDVTTPNKKLAECIDKQTRAVSWPDTVKSLNTVEYSF
jgi:hypothetical protein